MSNIKEQIRQEIDTRRQHIVEELMGHEENCEYHRIKGMHDAYVDLLTFLDYSLPEEKPSEDLNDEIKKFIEEYGYERGEDKLLIAIVARHFAKWQAEKCDEETSKLLYAERQTAYINGWDDHKEQMMKDAVEGEIVKDITNKLAVTAKNINLDGFKFGDKVKIIIVKGD